MTYEASLYYLRRYLHYTDKELKNKSIYDGRKLLSSFWKEQISREMWELTLHHFDIMKLSKYSKYFPKPEDATPEQIAKDFKVVKDILNLKPFKKKRK